jgi:hypothetical protein
MLSGLKIKAEIEEPQKRTKTFSWTYDANTLLSYMQQVWPGVTKAQGSGAKASPYRPKTAKQWFYCAKVKGSGSSAKRFPNLTNGQAWFEIGGRYIGIDPASFYASDYGTDGRRVALDAPTYPNLKEAVIRWKRTRGNTDIRLTKIMRDLMAGKMFIGSPAPAALPVLTVVLFVSEVARNHTAFHTNLMALDLIQDCMKMPMASGSIPWNWGNAIWIEDVCPDCSGYGNFICRKCRGSGCVRKTCSRCSGSGRFRRGQCRDCRGTGKFFLFCNSCNRGYIYCRRCRGKGRGTVFDEYNPKGVTTNMRGVSTFKGGGQVLQNGLLPMSHKGSAFGSAFDLTGDGAYKLVGRPTTINSSAAPSDLMVVRRKEASVLILWLERVLRGSEIPFNPKQTLKVTATVDKADISIRSADFKKVYDEVTASALAGRTLDDDTGSGDLESEVRDTVRSKIVNYLQMRTEVLFYAFDR